MFNTINIKDIAKLKGDKQIEAINAEVMSLKGVLCREGRDYAIENIYRRLIALEIQILKSATASGSKVEKKQSTGASSVTEPSRKKETVVPPAEEKTNVSKNKPEKAPDRKSGEESRDNNQSGRPESASLPESSASDGRGADGGSKS